MLRLAALFPLCLLLALPAASRAQGGARIVPYAGAAVGGASLPRAFQACPPGTRAAADARLGVALGAVALEARFAALADVGTMACLDAVADPAPLPDGVHTTTHYPFRGSPDHLAGDLRLRLGGTRALPLAVSGGGGWLRSPGVPYLLAAAGVRLGGRVRLAVDAERMWYRVERTAYTAEYRGGQVVSRISSEEQVAWPGGTGVRAGVELAFR